MRILAGGFDTGVYAYDGAGNVKTMGSDSFSYDSRSRLTSSTVSLQGLGYGYDRFGNLNPSLVNPGNNRLSAGTYDARGNLTEYAGQRYDYDGLSRQVAYNGGFERYLYDGAGERIARLTSPNPGTDFYTITPCRLLDTRTSPPSLSSTVSRVVQITGGCGVPAEASAVSGNLTVTNVSEQGFLRLFPTGTNPFVNGVSYRAGITRANNFNLGLSGLGRLTLTASTASTADGIVDVSGYYAYPAPTWTLTFRDEGNRLSSEYSVTSSTITRTKNYFHFGNLLVSTRDSGGTHLYYASDHLGTPRLVTNQGGAAVENHTYHPFGQEITPLFGNQPLKFAAMERDQASGNDSDHARVCSPAQGRFLSPDKAGGKLLDPQSWNRYAYAGNNPLRFTDPNGLEKITFTVMTFIAASVARPSLFGAQFGPRFAGDNRGFSLGAASLRQYRTLQQVTIETDPSKGRALVGNVRDTGVTTNLDTGQQAQASKAGLQVSNASRDPSGNTTLSLKGSASDPLFSLAPAVTYDLNITANRAGTQFTVTGGQGGFPSFEAYATNESGQTVTVSQYDEKNAPGGSFSLFPVIGDQKISLTCGFGDNPGCQPR